MTVRELQIRKRVAKNMKFYREQKGWSQAHLAFYMRVSEKTIGNWETTFTFPDLDMLIKLVDTLEAGSIHDFCTKTAKIGYSRAA